MYRPSHATTVTMVPDTVGGEVAQIDQDAARAAAIRERHYDAGVAVLGGVGTAVVAALYMTDRRTEAAVLSLAGGILGTVYAVARILGEPLEL